MLDVPQMPKEVAADPDQLKLAKTLVDSMSKKFNDLTLEDKYNNALRDVIDSKIEGKEVVIATEEEPEVVDIMTALKQSIEDAKKDKKPMEKAKADSGQEAEAKKAS